MKPIYLLILTIILGCTNNNEHKKDEKTPLIVTTTGIIKNSIKEIVKNHGDVKKIDISALLGPNSDPHLAKGSKEDLKLLFEADLIISNGLHLEGKLADLLNKFGKNKNHIRLSDGIADSLLIRSQNILDPHIWHDVKIWKHALQYAFDKIIESGIISPNEIRGNQNGYLKKLDILHKKIISNLSVIPIQRRYLVTSHDAFKYFGKAYNINVIGVQGISTLSQTSIKRRTELTNFMIEHDIHYIFPETSTKDNYVKAIIEDCAEKNYRLNIGEKLYSDALGGEESNANTYIKMIEYNVNIITAALND